MDIGEPIEVERIPEPQPVTMPDPAEAPAEPPREPAQPVEPEKVPAGA